MQLTRKQFFASFASLAALPLAANALPLPEAQEPNGRRLRPYEMWAEVRAVADLDDSQILVDYGDRFVPGDVFIVPLELGSGEQPELCRVCQVDGNLLFVQRDVGGTGRHPIPRHTHVRIIGNAFVEPHAQSL